VGDVRGEHGVVGDSGHERGVGQCLPAKTAASGQQ
jgi:hypothetical protein